MNKRFFLFLLFSPVFGLSQSTLVIISEGICGKLSLNGEGSSICKSYWLIESLPASELELGYILDLGEDEKAMFRTIQVDGISDYVYYVEEIAPFAFRFRYRGDKVPAKDYALFLGGKLISSTSEPPLDLLPIEMVEEKWVLIDSLPTTQSMDSLLEIKSTALAAESKDTVKRIEIEQPSMKNLEANNIAKSMLKGEHIPNEFDRFLFCKKMALGSEKLDEEWVRHLCSLLRYDQSRLDFLQTIAPRYCMEDWFEGLQDVFKFDALKLEFLKSVKANKLND